MSYTNPFLTRVAVATAIIPATDGTPTLVSTFGDRLYLGPGCEGLGNHRSPQTNQRTVEFPLLTETRTSAEIYGGFKSEEGVKLELDQLGLTLAQFCVEKDFFQDGDLALIQVEVEGVLSFFVAYVDVYDDGSLDVSVYELADDDVWVARYQRRVVVPQLDPATP